MKHLFWIVIILVVFNSSTKATAKMTGQANVGIAAVSYDGKAVTLLTLRPTMGVGNWKMGLDVNIFIPSAYKPSNIPYLMFRYVEYDDGHSGLRYGVLDGITLGYGLIMKDYSTLVSGGTLFDPNQAGIRAYTDVYEPYGLQAIMTRSQVYAGRVSYQPDSLSLFGRPVFFGVNYAVDKDGVKTKAKLISNGQSAMSADMGWSVMGESATVFAEIAQLAHYGQGSMFGLKGRLLGAVDYQLDYRDLGKRFVPGYFSYQYEVQPIDLSGLSNDRLRGYHGALDFALGSFVRFNVEYQNLVYASSKKENPSLKAELSTQEIANVSLLARYEQLQMRSLSAAANDGANVVVEALVPMRMVGIPFPGLANVSWKRTYSADAPNGKYYDSQSIGYQYSIPF